jgi:hypothetical protein
VSTSTHNIHNINTNQVVEASRRISDIQITEAPQTFTINKIEEHFFDDIILGAIKLTQEIEINTKRINASKKNSSYEQISMSKPAMPGSIEIDHGHLQGHTVGYSHGENVGYRIGGNTQISRPYNVNQGSSNGQIYSH